MEKAKSYTTGQIAAKIKEMFGSDLKEFGPFSFKGSEEELFLTKVTNSTGTDVLLHWECQGTDWSIAMTFPDTSEEYTQEGLDFFAEKYLHI